MTQPTTLEGKEAARRAEIERAAQLGLGDERPDWLDDVLASHGLDPEGGILVEYDTVEEEDRTLCHGTWLTRARQFWSFEVWVAPGAKPRVEIFEDVTALTSTAGHYPGLGKSFGALALEILDQLLPEKV